MNIQRLMAAAMIIFILVLGGLIFIGKGDMDKDETNERVRVGVLLNGECDDGSWGESHYRALESIKNEMGLDIIYRENVPEDETCQAVIQELIDSDCSIIIAASYNYGEYVKKMAEKYPKVYFLHATGVDHSENLSTYFGRIYQMRYLSGIVAGMNTESGDIGYVAAYPISEVNRGLNAFTRGVRSVRPDAKVYAIFTNDWNSDEITRASAERLLSIKPDIDVMSMHTDSLAVLDCCEERGGIKTVGYNTDNASDYPDTYLTAAVWDWSPFYRKQITSCIQDKFYGDHYWMGLEDGIMDLSPFTGNVKEGTEEAVEKARQRLESGTWDVFYGLIRDNKGNTRIGEGEAMSDDDMLNSFDWYVEGVVVVE